MPGKGQESLCHRMHIKGKYYCPWKTFRQITRTMCPKPVGLCSQQGVRCHPALECAFSRQPVPGGGKNPLWPPPPGCLWRQGPSGALKSLHLCLLHTSCQPFPNRKEENDVFVVLPLPQQHLTLSRQFPKEPLFRAFFCVLGGERKRIKNKTKQKKPTHCHFTNHKNI